MQRYAPVTCPRGYRCRRDLRARARAAGAACNSLTVPSTAARCRAAAPEQQGHAGPAASASHQAPHVCAVVTQPEAAGCG